MTITVCNGDMAASKYKMKKKLGIGIVCISLLLVACGNVTEETVTFDEEPETEEPKTEETEPEEAVEPSKTVPEKPTYISEEFWVY